jgi:CDP-4-dehydro-6-deoxyglucose reductase, E1
MIDLVKDTITSEDRKALSEWILKDPKLTKGDLTIKFEKDWSSWLGTKHSVFVNSGSSANLLMALSILENEKLKNKKIIVPAVSWSTTIAPFIQLGFEPIMCDCDPESLGLNIKHLKKLIKLHDPGLIIVVHVLGHSNEMDSILEISNNNNIFLLEDCCEAHGSKYKNKKLGTFGIMSSFSFYYGHHMSTIEGGMVSTNCKKMNAFLLMIRSHGWIRDLDKESAKIIKTKYNIDDFNSAYSFIVPGLNVRSTDLNAFLGLRQLKGLDSVVKKRRENYNLYKLRLEKYTWVQNSQGCLPSPLAYGIIDKKREKIVKSLISNNIECRPLICGSIAEHPFWYERYGKNSSCINAKKVHTQGLYVPCHQDLKKEEINYICNIVIESLR